MSRRKDNNIYNRSFCPLKLSETNTVRLLKLYQREPCLYDLNSRDYRNRDARASALIRIASALSVDGFGTQEVQTKFKNLRNSYSQELKKIDDAAGGNQLYVPKVYWFNTMDSFLRPQMYATKSNSGNLDKQGIKRTASRTSSDADEVAENIFFKEEELTDGWTGFEFNDSASRSRTEQTSVVGSCASSASRTSRKATGQDDTMVKAVERLTEATKLAASSTQSDMYDKFGGFVAEVLRKAGYNKSLLIINDISAVLARHAVEKVAEAPQSASSPSEFS